MSIRVDMADLASHVVGRGGGFLLSAIMDSRPHVAHLVFDVASDGGQVELRARVGRTSYANCERQSSVTVLWPSPLAVAERQSGDAGDAGSDDADLDAYSLIVDGEARPDGPDHVIITATSALFHRPAPVVVR